MEFQHLPSRTTLTGGFGLRVLTIIFSILITAGCTTLPDQPVPVAIDGKSRAIVFDVDGTLTPKPIAINTARENAARAVNLFAENGYTIIYLSARNLFFQFPIPDWLQENDFPAGIIHVPRTHAEHFNPAEFKAGMLQKYVDEGWMLVAAYGDTHTDFEAYSQVGIPRERIFAVQREDAEQCQLTEQIWAECLTGWQPHFEQIMQIISLEGTSGDTQPPMLNSSP
ncbi:LNS2 domain-containing protein [Alteromonas sp. ASW11-130]|uniref:LNS2 domain-containing protein n=1 Tax=Alteromonas sp. ASW11-130 TaxID=3015775 RepID=UPI002241BF12|nr:hypothetical protein [Alteromonas sp. ASW11-130]MCW8091970.1 hypothetical protein [Alteromonas sp. ASW11-130]